VEVNAGKRALPDYETSTTYLKVDLIGIRPEHFERVPLNVALVIDKSGSMNGQKIQDAKTAAIYFIQQLERDDILSVVTYSSGVEVLIPATKVTDKNRLIRRVRSIFADGNTALFAGVSKGAAEVRKFFNEQRVNRVILLSDGLANSGPSSPHELGQLGKALAREQISVSTLGIGSGYNEDLMTKLAYHSDGNHVFVSNSTELADIFSQELKELSTVTAKEIRIRIRACDDFELVRILGREGEVRGNMAEILLNQVSGNQEKYVMVELRYDPAVAKRNDLFASVEVDYLDPFASKRMQTTRQYSFERVQSKDDVMASVDKGVIKEATLQIATNNVDEAVRLRDEGKLEQAEAVFRGNADMLEATAEEYEVFELSPFAVMNTEDAGAVYDEDQWDDKRKQLREEQNTVRTKQSVGSSSNRYISEEGASDASETTPEK